MTDRVIVEGLSVARVLYDFINREVLPGTGVPEAGFWTRLDRIVHDLGPEIARSWPSAMLCRRRSTNGIVPTKANPSTLRLIGPFSARSDIWFRREMTSPSTPRTWTTR